MIRFLDLFRKRVYHVERNMALPALKNRLSLNNELLRNDRSLS